MMGNELLFVYLPKDCGGVSGNFIAPTERTGRLELSFASEISYLAEGRPRWLYLPKLRILASQYQSFAWSACRQFWQVAI